MFTPVIKQNFKAFNSSIVVISILISSIALIFDVIVVIILIYNGKFAAYQCNNRSRRISLLYSINTYIHLVGILSTLLIMCIRTLYVDIYKESSIEYMNLWSCHFLSYLIPLFASGVYGSCFLQALYRFWRILLPTKTRYQKQSFHLQLIFVHWIFILLLTIPILPSSIYIKSDNICLVPFDDLPMATYISFMSALFPVIGIFILYVRIVVHMKNKSKKSKLWKRMKRDMKIIRRILLLVIIILQTSSAGIIVWIITLFNDYLQTLFYRVLRFIIVLCMTIFSITIILVSPQLKRIFKSQPHRKSRESSTTFQETILL